MLCEALLEPPLGQRVDGNTMAGTGFPSCHLHSSPRGLDSCPLPDVVVVHFPCYVGPALLPGLPRTWVPVPSAEVIQHTLTQDFPSKFLLDRAVFESCFARGVCQTRWLYEKARICRRGSSGSHKVVTRLGSKLAVRHKVDEGLDCAQL